MHFVGIALAVFGGLWLFVQWAEWRERRGERREIKMMAREVERQKRAHAWAEYEAKVAHEAAEHQAWLARKAAERTERTRRIERPEPGSIYVDRVGLAMSLCAAVILVTIFLLPTGH